MCLSLGGFEPWNINSRDHAGFIAEVELVLDEMSCEAVQYKQGF